MEGWRQSLLEIPSRSDSCLKTQELIMGMSRVFHTNPFPKTFGNERKSLPQNHGISVYQGRGFNGGERPLKGGVPFPSRPFVQISTALHNKHNSQIGHPKSKIGVPQGPQKRAKNRLFGLSPPNGPQTPFWGSRPFLGGYPPFWGVALGGGAWDTPGGPQATPSPPIWGGGGVWGGCIFKF